MQLIKNKPTIIWYRGGGYDSCMWEPNAVLWTGRGLKPLLCTGINGLFYKVTTPGNYYRSMPGNSSRLNVKFRIRGTRGYERYRHLKGLKAYLESPEFEQEDLIGEHENTPDGWAWACRHIREDYVVYAAKTVSHTWRMEEAFVTCTECNKPTDPHTIEFEGYRGDGGIGVVHEGIICEACYSRGQCVSCQSFDAEVYKGGMVCSNCVSDAKRDDAEFGEALDNIEEDKIRVQKQAKELAELRPEKSDVYAAQLKVLLEELDGQLVDLMVSKFE